MSLWGSMQRVWCGTVASLLVSLCGIHASAAPAEAPTVAVSIAPLHSIVSAVMGDAGEPALLIPSGQSPHTFTLRASTLKTMNSADILVLVAPKFETALQKALSASELIDRTVYISAIESVDWLAARGDGHHHHLNGLEASKSDPDLVDWHFWLNPDNGVAVALALAETLSKADPANALRYQANAETFVADIEALTATLGPQLQPAKSKPYVVFHDAYQYFEYKFGLETPAVVTVAPDRQPSAKQVSELRAQIRDKGIKCVFAEPQFPSPILNILKEDLPVTMAVLDPIGSELTPSAGLYRALLSNLGQSMADCLAAP